MNKPNAAICMYSCINIIRNLFTMLSPNVRLCLTMMCRFHRVQLLDATKKLSRMFCHHPVNRTSMMKTKKNTKKNKHYYYIISLLIVNFMGVFFEICNFLHVF